MVCLGLEPGAAGWKVQTNPLSYGIVDGGIWATGSLISWATVWPDFKNFTRFATVFGIFESLISFGNFLNLILGCFSYWANIYSWKWPKIEQIILPFGHTGGNQIGNCATTTLILSKMRPVLF